MYNVGEMVFYGGHGVCEIEEITTMTVSNEERQYYRLKSHVQPTLSLFHPVVTDKPKISKMLASEEIEKILMIFKNEPSEWIERSIDRAKAHKKIMETKDQFLIAQMINTILRKELELQAQGKKLYAQDQELVRSVMAILSDQISISLMISKEEVQKRIEQYIQQ